MPNFEATRLGRAIEDDRVVRRRRGGEGSLGEGQHACEGLSQNVSCLFLIWPHIPSILVTVIHDNKVV